MKKFLIFLLLGMSMNTYADVNLDAGKKLASTCVACHGVGGNSAQGTWPKLAGQNPDYLVKAMKEYQKGDKGGRNNPVMLGMVKALSEEDMENLAAYFAAQKVTVGNADPKLVEAGQAIYRGGLMNKGVPACMACHGPAGLGNNEAKYPALSGQHAEYVVTVLNAYRNGTRHDDASGIMQDIAKKMSDDDIKAVASYIQGLH